MAYREPPAVDLLCPRCKKRKLPPLEIAACACGTWVTTFVADVVLTERDRTPDPVTRWWRVLEPCPICDERMQLHGDEPGLLLGCTGHGFWIDADTIAHTGLARPVDQEALERKRNDDAAIAADREHREIAELHRAQLKAARQRAEAAVGPARFRHRGRRPAVENAAPAKPRPEKVVPEEPGLSRLELEAAFLATLDPVMRRLWHRVAELERKNAELERRIINLES